MPNDRTRAAAFRAAFPYTLPICAGFTFLGLAYGLMMRSQGFAFWWPILMSMTIFAGSMEFIMADLLLSAFQPLSAFLLALMVNALPFVLRHRHAGPVPGHWLEESFPDLRHV